MNDEDRELIKKLIETTVTIDWMKNWETEGTEDENS